MPAPDGPPPGELGDLLAWLRAPGVLDRASLADSLEIRARRTGALSAGQARRLWEERNWPLEVIDRLAETQARSAAALLDRAARELYRLFCAPRRAGAAVLGADELDEASALAAGRRALGELRELSRIAPELAPADAQALARSLERVELLGGAGGAGGGRDSRSKTVAVLDPLALRARRVRALFVSGLQEGAFPARGRPQPFLGEDERRRLAEVSGLRLGEQEDVLAAERYLLYAALSRPEELLFLSWHVADDDGEPTSRSLFVEDVCDLFTEGLYARRASRPLGAVDGVHSAPAARTPAQGGGSLRDVQLLAGLRSRVWSASSLERWIGCPVRWYVESMLDPEAIEPHPEPLARGGLAHAALKDTLEGLARETGSARLTPASLQLARELLASSLAAHEADHPLSVGPERRVAARRRLHADLERYLRHASESAGSLEPRELELGFGFAAEDERGEGSNLPPFDMGGGVMLRGRIDRIDVDEGGRAVVYDYKGRSVPAAARWLRDGNLQVALYMRAVEQLLGLNVVGGLYQPLSGEDLRARGLLDGDSGVAIECVSTDVREHAQVRELLDEALAAAREVAEQAGRGELEARPRTLRLQGRLPVSDDLPVRAMTGGPRETGAPPGEQMVIPGTEQEPIPAALAALVETLTHEQEHAVARRAEPLLVSAAAGSGKTSVLVERFVRAVREDGIAPGRILAITFTERAAGELRARVRARLLELGDREAARDTEAAFVGTFHGFCARLLRAHPLAAGSTPTSPILDEGLAGRLREQAFATAAARSSSPASGRRRWTCSPPTASIASAAMIEQASTPSCAAAGGACRGCPPRSWTGETEPLDARDAAPGLRPAGRAAAALRRRLRGAQACSRRGGLRRPRAARAASC